MNNLSQFYNDLKKDVGDNKFTKPFSFNNDDNIIDTSKIGALSKFNAKLGKNSDQIKDRCGRKLLINLYLDILPLDDEYKKNNIHKLSLDVDNMLSKKNMSAYNYFKSSYESTKAPLLEFVLRSIDNISREYVEEAREEFKLREKESELVEIPSDEGIEDQIIDVEKDTEYDTFMDTLKKKTVNKIVNDISSLINKEKEEEDSEFKTSNNIQESKSAISICMDYLQKKIKSDSITESIQEDMIALSIRETAINQLDVVFDQTNKDLKIFENMINLNRGYVINESSIGILK